MALMRVHPLTNIQQVMDALIEILHCRIGLFPVNKNLKKKLHNGILRKCAILKLHCI